MHCSFMVDLKGYELEEIEREILRHPLVDAVILFTRNFKNKSQLVKLIEDIRATNAKLFIAVDHEGGYVQRFQRNGFRALPSARFLGEIYDINQAAGIEAARHCGKVMAEDLLTCGVDLSLAPVIDLHNEKSEIIGQLDRAFHASPYAVAQLAGAFIEGMNAAGMLAVAKHFPGHGSCHSDSHIVKPMCDVSYQELAENDLKPFESLIQSKKLHAVMPAHITYSQLDKENPAGYSSFWLQEVLRRQLGFNGLILSDCLSMTGADIGDLQTRAERAFAAGCNMAIIANQPRPVLLEVLQSLQNLAEKDVDSYVKNFKQSICRFKGNSSVETAISNSIWRKEEKISLSTIDVDLNRTTGI